MKKLLTILGAVVMFATGEAWAASAAKVTIAVASTPGAGELDANTSNLAVFRFRLYRSSGGDAVTATSIRFTAGGTAVVPTEVDQVKLYQDSDNDAVFDVETDAPLGSAQVFTSGNNTVNFTGLSLNIDNTGLYFWGVVRTTANAAVGNTFTLGIAAASDVSVVGATKTASTTGTASSNTFTFYGLKVALGANTPPGDSAWTSSLYKDILQFQLNAYGENVNVTSVKLTAGGTAALGPSGDITQFKLYLDANNNGRYDSGETQLGLTQTAASTVTFSGFSQSVTAGGSVNLVAVSVANTSVTAGRTFSLRVAASGDVSGTGATTSKTRSGQGTAQGNTMTFSQGNPALNIALGQNSRPTSALQWNVTNQPVLQVKFNAFIDGVKITSIKLTHGGTTAPSDFGTVSLYVDADSSGTVTGGETAFATATLGATNTFSGLSIVAPSGGQGLYVLATVNSSTTASPGETLTLSIATETDVVGEDDDTPSMAAYVSGSATSNTMRFPKLSVALGPSSPVGGTVKKNTYYTMLQARISAADTNMSVTSIKLTLTGTIPLNASPGVGNVAVYLDANSNGLYDTGETIFGTSTASASTITYTGTAAVAKNGYIDVVAYVYINNSKLTAGQTLRVSIAADADVSGTAAGYPITSLGTATGNLFTTGNDPNNILIEPGLAPPAAGPIYISTNDQAIFQFSISATSNSAASVTSITLTAGGSGTVPSSDIAEVRLYEDLNESGTLDANDGVALGTQSFAAPSGTTVTFGSLTISVPINSRKVFLAVVRTTATGGSGNTFTLGIASTAGVTATGGTVTLSTTPLNSSTFTFPGYLTTALGANTAAADTMHTFNGAHTKGIFQFAVTAVGENMNLTSVKLTAGGTATLPTEIAQISLYSDANNNGQFDVGETQRGTTQTAASTVTFTISGLTITAGATERFVAVAHIPSDISASANGKTFSLSIAAASDVAGANASGYYRASEGTATSNTMTFYDGTKGVLNVSNSTSNPGAGRLENSGTFTVFQFKLSPLGEAFDLSKSDLSYNKVAIQLGGTATFGAGSDIVSMSLYKSDGTTQLGSTQTTASSGVVTFTWTSPAIQIASGGNEELIVKVTAGTGAQGRTLTLSIPDTGYVVGRGVTSGKWIGSAGTASSATWSFSDLTVALGPHTPAAAVLSNSATKVSVLQVKLGAVAENVNIDGASNYLKVTLSGLAGTTGFGTQITGVSLWEDANNDGVADATQLGSTQTTATANVVTFSWTTPTTQVTGGGYSYVVVAVNTGTGVAGNTLGLTVEAGQVQGTGASTSRTLSSTGTAVSNVFNFANPTDVVGVSRGNAPVTAGQININQDNIPMMQLRLAGPGNKAATVTGITFTNAGTSWGAYETAEVRLYYDNNTDGQLDVNDNLIDTRSFATTTSNTVAFTGLNIPLAQNGSKTVLAVLKTNSNGISGNTIALQLPTNTAVTAISSVTTSLSETPLTAATKTFATGQVTVSKDAELAPAGVSPGARNVALMRLKFTVSGPAVKVSSIKVDNTYCIGTYDEADIDSVEIYRDGGDLSFSATGDLLVAAAGVTGLNGGSGTASFTAGVGDTVRASAEGYFYVVYDVATTAVSTRQFGATLADNTYIGTNSIGTIAATNFPIQIGAEHSLPVEFASFTAEAVGQAVKLLWATESETDNLYWIVERKEASATDATYVQIHRLDGMGSTPYRTDYEFVDRSVVPGTRYAYRLTDVSRYGVRKTHDPVEVTAGAALALALGNAFPNPANPATVWAYSLPDEQSVRLAVYNTLGQQVRVLVNGRVAAGTHQARWDITDDNGRAMASGVYFAVMETPTSRLVSRVTVVR